MSAAGIADPDMQPPVHDRLLEVAGISIDRMPMLRVVFDRLATSCADALRPLSPSPILLSMEGVETGRIGDVLSAYQRGAVAAVLYASEWDTRILVGLDRDCTNAILEALFGGDGTEPQDPEDRAFTTIEMKVAQLVFEHVAAALAACFASVGEAPFKIERVETRLDFAVIGRRNNPAVVTRIAMQAHERGGDMFIVIPQSALTPMRQNLARVLSGDVSPSDPRWTRQIHSEVARTEVRLRAILEEREMTLGEVAELRAGMILPLEATPRTRVRLECADQPLFWCELGRSDSVYTLRVEDFIDKNEDVIDDLVSG
ncbi:flagellar motor switch protein FliM [Propylenella binzhouense]|uniref:Flagellar motor switch protein FliM n=1 Tax=Propylenella binzhouense TaxID=2555902 RepID=A0A964T1Z3_9HYPH|nr:FliM/FliN family flagellar motor switch protein [Propylenella binzhouense]MYZ46988.1 flagellar motor switch protein FliM [Propylenella binzhouense]